METMDTFVNTLFVTGRATLEQTESVSPMLCGTLDGQERIMLLLPNPPNKEENYIKYVQAVTLCLFMGIENLYELRDATGRNLESVDEEPAIPLEEDPLSYSALLVYRHQVAGDPHTEGFMMKYGLSDFGKYKFDEILPMQQTVAGVYHDGLMRCVRAWKDHPAIIDPEALEVMRVRLGFMGRVARG